MSNTVNDLRDELFATLRALRSGELDVEKARAVSEVAQTIINSAKVEVDYIKANGGGESSFIDAIGTNNLPAGVNGRTVHRIKG